MAWGDFGPTCTQVAAVTITKIIALLNPTLRIPNLTAVDNPGAGLLRLHMGIDKTLVWDNVIVH